jgi:hypothetical protein
METASEHLEDYRTGKNTRHSLLGMFRQSVYGRLAGYEDGNDADRLRNDPAMRTIVGERAGDKPSASTSEMGRFETEILSQKKNIRALMALPGKLVDCANKYRQLKNLVLDMDSSVSETYGQQQGTAYNGHFSCTCYHPLFVFNQFGDLENAMLRRGNQHSAKYWKYVLLPVIARYRHLVLQRFFRGDAAFAMPGLYMTLEKEGKNAVKWTKLSCKNFRDNQVRLQLFALAYNMGNFLRTLVLPRSIKHWTLTTMREKLIKIGAKMVTTARYVYFQMAEVAVPRELFASILSRINGLRPLAVT